MSRGAAPGYSLDVASAFLCVQPAHVPGVMPMTVPSLEGVSFSSITVLEQCQLSLRKRDFQAYIQGYLQCVEPTAMWFPKFVQGQGAEGCAPLCAQLPPCQSLSG